MSPVSWNSFEPLINNLLNNVSRGTFSLENNVPRETLGRLLRYSELVWNWNQKINLTGAKSPSDFIQHHLIDCISAYAVAPLSSMIVDVGSGSGLPGIVWGILDKEKAFYLIEPIKKKAAFLQKVISELKLENISVHPTKIEALNVPRETFFSNSTYVSRGTFNPKALLTMAKSLKPAWKRWLVFGSELSLQEYLTISPSFGISVSAIDYSVQENSTFKLIVLE